MDLCTEACSSHRIIFIVSKKQKHFGDGQLEKKLVVLNMEVQNLTKNKIKKY